MYKCPVCDGPLGHEKVDDGMIINKITDDGKTVSIKEIHNKSNGYDLIFCWNHRLSHKIPSDIRVRTLDLIKENQS